MATKSSTIEFILDQLASLPDVTARKMFGEYALYCEGKVVALVCDDRLYVKITEAGKALLGPDYAEGYAYRGAKASMLIDEDLIEDRERLSALLCLTAQSLPPKKSKNR